MRTIVWYRGKDLRLSDHPPLRRALLEGEVLPLFILDPRFVARDRVEHHTHRIQFLLDSLGELADGLAKRGSKLLVQRGDPLELVPELLERWSADRIVAHRRVEPGGRKVDRSLRARLGERFELFEGETLLAPGQLRTSQGDPYRVFTPFSRAFMERCEIGLPLPTPQRLPAIPAAISRDSLGLPSCAQLGLDPNPAILSGGERAGRERLRRFTRGPAMRYARDRDRMDKLGTSRLSADLKFGTVSVRQVWTSIQAAQAEATALDPFCRQLLWREFTHNLLWEFPRLLAEPFRPQFRGFPWSADSELLSTWQEGRTGYPIVDAAMRQLRVEGFMHNRARMITASFLTKHLLIDYRLGEAHFMRYLTDGDPAQNNAGWQWSAGCGCDAQPYFRVFNPITQGRKFDPDGAYVRRYLPELARVPTRYIHAPWTADPGALATAGLQLGRSFPYPIVEHRTARERFLAVASQYLRA